MNRKVLRDFTHKAEAGLSLDSTNYKQWVFRYTFLELEKDLGVRGDITSKSIFHEKKHVKAKIVAKSSGILAGAEEIMYFLVNSDPVFKPNISGPISVNFLAKDGEQFAAGDVLAEIEAEIHDLAAVERTVLNLLLRMSNVASFTHKIVNLVRDYDVMIAPTRKTLWGLLDKKAVVLGGGGSHRLNLADAILVKDTHLDVYERDFELVLQKIYESSCDSRFLEIEVLSADEALVAAKALDRFISEGKLKTVGVIMFDNMRPEEIENVVKRLKEAGLYENILLEGSGGINEGNVVEYAKTGVDIVSMSALTAGVSGVDLSLKIL